jgi:succinate-acetate transporter protein
LTTFLLSCINLGVRDLASPAMVIAPALAYGGLVQLLAGMWEIAVGMCTFRIAKLQVFLLTRFSAI